MKLPALHIGNLTATVPIVQGGMGIGVSLSGLASAVANEGGVGVISAANVGFNEPDFKTNTVNANLRAEVRRYGAHGRADRHHRREHHVQRPSL